MKGGDLFDLSLASAGDFFFWGIILVIAILSKIGVATLIVVGLSFPVRLHSQPPTPVSTPKPMPDLPSIFVHIADCESGQGKVSGAKQFNADGSVVRGKANPQDIGKYQINEYWNGATATKLGYDIFTLEGNTEMAAYLYKHQGLKPWGWSKPCWGQYLPVSG